MKVSLLIIIICVSAIIVVQPARIINHMDEEKMAKSFIGCIKKVMYVGHPSANIPNLTELLFPLNFSVPMDLMNVTGDIDFYSLIVTGLTDLNVTKIGGVDRPDRFHYTCLLRWPVIGFRLNWRGNISEDGVFTNKSGYLIIKFEAVHLNGIFNVSSHVNTTNQSSVQFDVIPRERATIIFEGINPDVDGIVSMTSTILLNRLLDSIAESIDYSELIEQIKDEITKTWLKKGTGINEIIMECKSYLFE